LALLVGMIGCAPDLVEPNGFQRRGADAGVDAATATAPAPVDAATGGTSVSGDTAAAPAGCDLGGRWLVVQRVLATAIGQQQAAHTWYYFEIQQQGAEVTVTRGLHCGFDVIKKTSLAASVDSSAAWPALLQRNSSSGRRGRFVAEGGGCRLTLDREYVVRGATLPFYLDPARPLPDRMAMGGAGMPGWEDWDGDGNPGISLKVSSSLASGTLYTCQRDWTIYDGATAAGANKLKVSIRYGGEQVALGRSAGAAQAIESGSSPASDPAQHYAWFHRLGPAEARGSDAEICASVRTLKDTLLPEANQ
jgi:hypothetical protein